MNVTIRIAAYAVFGAVASLPQAVAQPATEFDDFRCTVRSRADYYERGLPALSVLGRYYIGDQFVLDLITRTMKWVDIELPTTFSVVHKINDGASGNTFLGVDLEYSRRAITVLQIWDDSAEGYFFTLLEGNVFMTGVLRTGALQALRGAGGGSRMTGQPSIGGAAVVAMLFQIASCGVSASSDLVLKCEGRRIETYEKLPFQPEPQDVSVVLRFDLGAFSSPPSDKREILSVVQELKGRSIMTAADSPSTRAQHGELGISDRELTLSANEQSPGLFGALQPDHYRFQVSRLTGDYSASWYFPGTTLIKETGRCEPFDPGTKKF